MALLLLLGALGLLLLPGLTRRLGRRLAPAEWVRLCAVALVGGACALELAALLYAAPTVLHASGAPGLARICERAFGHLVPAGAVAGWSALVGAVAMPALVLLAGTASRRRSRALWVEPCVGLHRPVGAHELVELPTPLPLAIAVAGPTSQIVVSQGLVDLLSPPELRAVIAHEAAHLDLRHHRLLAVVTGIERGLFFLPLRRSAAAVRCAVERSADEVAAGRSAEGRATLRSALLQVTVASVSASAIAFSTADTVVERLESLAHPVQSPSVVQHAALYLPGTLVGVATFLTLGGWVGHGQLVSALAGHCLA